MPDGEESWKKTVYGGFLRESNSYRLRDHGFEARGAGPPVLEEATVDQHRARTVVVKVFRTGNPPRPG